MNKSYNLITLVLFLLLCSCTEREQNPDNGKGRDYPTDDTFVLIDQSMSYMRSDPSTAHRMLDSIADAGLMTRQRCDYFHAMVVFSGERKFDRALEICDSLLEAGVFGDDHFLEEELCVLASNITSGTNNHLATLKYANRGLDLCHGDERMRGDEATLMARVGLAEQALGRTEQARETFDRAYQLLKGTSSFADLVALITLQKRQMSLYSEMKDYGTVISTCHEIEHLLEHFEHDPSFVEKRPATMQEPGSATKGFADFYRCQVYSQLARAYRLRIEQGLTDNISAETDSIRLYINKLLNTEGVQTSSGLISSMYEMQFVGLKAEFDHAKPRAEQRYQGDSLVREYVDYLSLLANDAESRHELQASINYLKRAMSVSDTINQRELARILSEQMSINMVQEQQLARQDAERLLNKQRMMIRFLLIALIVGLAIGWLLYKNRKKEEIIKITRQDLKETKEEVKELTKQLEITKSEKALDNTQLLYERIEKVMEEKKLFLNPDLDIKMLSEAANSSRPIVSACINSKTGKPFRIWLSEYRLSLFEKMLRQNPETPVDEIAESCGYKDQSTFRRQFKEKYGMSPLKYRKNLENNGSPSPASTELQ